MKGKLLRSNSMSKMEKETEKEKHKRCRGERSQVRQVQEKVIIIIYHTKKWGNKNNNQLIKSLGKDKVVEVNSDRQLIRVVDSSLISNMLLLHLTHYLNLSYSILNLSSYYLTINFHLCSSSGFYDYYCLIKALSSTMELSTMDMALVLKVISMVYG